MQTSIKTSTMLSIIIVGWFVVLAVIIISFTHTYHTEDEWIPTAFAAVVMAQAFSCFAGSLFCAVLALDTWLDWQSKINNK
jgi:hypothetical protein